jgi:hypothetical protein
MARDHDRKRIARVRAADGARSVRQAEPRRLLGIRARLAVRDLRERKPGALLECRAGEIEREVELLTPPGEVLLELRLRILDERARPDASFAAPVEPLQAAFRRDDPQWAERRQSSAPSSCSSCTFRSSPPA